MEIIHNLIINVFATIQCISPTFDEEPNPLKIANTGCDNHDEPNIHESHAN